VPQQPAPVPPAWDFSRGVAMDDARFAPAIHGFTGEDLMDHCFQGWDGVAEISWPDRVIRLTMQADEIFRNFVIYIPQGKPFFCAEAVTHTIDGFNLSARGVPDTGMIVLEHGESLSGKTWFEAAAFE